MLGGVIGAGIPRRPGLLLPGLFTPPSCMLDLHEIGGEERPPFCRLLDLPQSYLPILASITFSQDSIVMPRHLKAIEFLVIHMNPILLQNLYGFLHFIHAYNEHRLFPCSEAGV